MRKFEFDNINFDLTMTENPTQANQPAETTVEERLRLLHRLQSVDSEVDEIKTLRGELPLEVRDLEDEIEGLETRISNYEGEISELKKAVTNKKQQIKNAQSKIEKYDDQMKNVRNNREYESLSKELEYEKLEIELFEKNIREFQEQQADKRQQIEGAQQILDERHNDLEHKQEELKEIVNETQEREERLKKEWDEIASKIESRLLQAYKRIRSNARNGLAVVTVWRDACGGCFNEIPPQRQLEIRSRKKIIVCEYCGRILVDKDIEEPLIEELR